MNIGQTPWSRTKPPPNTPINRGHTFARGILGAWLLNDVGDTARGTHGSGTDLTLGSGVTWGAGGLGGGSTVLNFTGVSGGAGSWASATHTSAFNVGSKEMSILAWVKVTGTIDASGSVVAGSYHTTIANAGYNIFVYTTDRAFFLMSDGTTTAQAGAGSINVGDGKWHQIVGVRDNKAVLAIVYADGRQDATADATGVGALDNAAIPYAIGAGDNSGSPNQGLNGQIDHVVLWNRKLSPDEVWQLYQNPYDLWLPQQRPRLFTIKPQLLGYSTNQAPKRASFF